MDNAIVKIGISIVSILIFIYIIKNFKEIIKKSEKYKNNKIIKYVSIIIIICMIIYFINYIYNQIILLKANIDWYKTSKENDAIFEKYDELILEENKFYKEIINSDYENQKYSEPYIPEGFSYVEGEWNSGFVIQDSNQNQYVWVPCTNKENSEVEILQRTNWSSSDFISKDICNNDEYKDFLQSTLENGGFYISRFEIGKENEKPVSKRNVEVWKDVTKAEANKIIKPMHDNINCDLINGYAYDTTLLWLMNSNEIKENIIDVKNQETIYTGRTSYNNIFDITDNVMEITSETTYSNVIIRGFPYEIAEDTTEYTYNNFGYNVKNFDRFSIKETENYFTTTTILGFRTVIYK